MPHLKYVGRADRREFSAADLKKLGVEDGKKRSFTRNEVVEVSDAEVTALTETGSLKGQFEVVNTSDTTPSDSDDEVTDDSAETLTPTGTRSRTAGRTSGSTRTSTT